MLHFGLHPDIVAANPGLNCARPPSLPFSIVYGALAFSLVAAAGYSLWAFRLIRHDLTLYSSIAAVFLVLGPFALNRLVVGRHTFVRFAALFFVGFLLYAGLWTAVWRGLDGKNLADLWAALLGLAAMTALFRHAFNHTGGLLAFAHLFLALFAFHSAGYYAGDALYAAMGKSTGRLLWGAAHGLGFGAGLGYVLFHVQSPLKKRLSPARPA